MTLSPPPAVRGGAGSDRSGRRVVLAATGARLVGGAGRTALAIQRHFMIMQARGLADGSGRLGRRRAVGPPAPVATSVRTSPPRASPAA